MDLYVCIRRGYKGEGLLRYLKPMIRQGVHKTNFSKKLLNTFYKDRFLQIVVNVNVEETEDTQEGEQRDDVDVRYTKFRTYKSLSTVKEAVEEGKSVSVIVGITNKIYVSYSEDKVHKICEILVDDAGGELLDGTYIASLTYGDSQEIERKKLFLSQNVQMWALVLPLVQRGDTHMYYIITDEWKERFYDKNTGQILFILPRIEGCKY